MIFVKHVTTLPNPSGNAVFRAQSLINECLLVETLLKIFVTNASLHFSLDNAQRVVNVGHVHFLVEKWAQLLERYEEAHLLAHVSQLGVEFGLHAVDVSVAR